MATAATATAATATATATTGCVKWFNNKAGYGFISVTEDGNTQDVFVHHTAIQVGQTQYKYLVQGEYVELTISPTDSDKHTIQVSTVRGVNGGKLMCETRSETRALREEHRQPAVRQTSKVQRQNHAAPAGVPRARESRPPQLSKSDETEWMIVPRRTNVVQSANKRARPQQRQPIVELA